MSAAKAQVRRDDATSKNPAILELWQAFVVNRRLTFDLVRDLPAAMLTQQLDRPGLDTVSKHITEMAAVEIAFGAALATGVMDFSEVPGVFEFKASDERELLIALLTDADKQMKARLDGSLADAIRWDDIDVSPIVHMTNLVSHEVFHQGQLAMACYAMKVELPQSWAANWALPRLT